MKSRPPRELIRGLLETVGRWISRIIAALAQGMLRICKSRTTHALCYVIAGLCEWAVSPTLAGVYFALAIVAFFGRHS